MAEIAFKELGTKAVQDGQFVHQFIEKIGCPAEDRLPQGRTQVSVARERP
jgi:hypothetical protein